MRRIFTFILVLASLIGFGTFKTIPYANAENGIKVYVDIKPGACPNYLNIRGRGYVQVAVLGTKDFDVADIDPTEFELEREGIDEEVEPVRWMYEDAATPLYEKADPCDCHVLGGDGYIDLVLRFDTQELIRTLKLNDLVGENVPLTLSGELIEAENDNENENEDEITGQDCVLVIDQPPIT